MTVWTAASQHAADTIRILAAEAIERAKSGHPGMPMGCAELVHVLFYKYLRHNPARPSWPLRDRFILSAGHASMLLYTLQFLYDAGVSADDLKNFRQFGSRTPGHPEYPLPGVEVTTGPLGAGFASSVGMAIASKHICAAAGLDNAPMTPEHFVVLMGDGCMMEGCTAEAASLAGHLKLNNIIAIYDSNRITIEGGTDLAFTEDVGKRFDAYNWRVVHIADGHNFEEIDRGLEEAFTLGDSRPTLVICRTQIGHGAPTKCGKANAHGEPLGAEELAGTKQALGFPAEHQFTVAADVQRLFAERRAELVAQAELLDTLYETFLNNNPESRAKIEALKHPVFADDLYARLVQVAQKYDAKSVATRQVSGDAIQLIAADVPALMGGAADLAPSTKAAIKNGGDFTPETPAGRNIHYGVRELAMGFAGNGLSIYGAAIAFSSTFFVFSDYMKPAIRLAAMQKIKHIYVFTHDTFYVGEDGPTHQPVEQLVMLRTIPGLTVIRPADAYETVAAWNAAIRMQTPVALILTRQGVPAVSAPEGLDEKILKGAYVLDDQEGFDTLLMATGSEVAPTLQAARALREKGWKIRVVSMPSETFFNAQSAAYRESVLPERITRRVTVEACTTYGKERYATTKGLMIGMDHFGASAPGSVLAEKFGFTAPEIQAAIEKFFA